MAKSHNHTRKNSNYQITPANFIATPPRKARTIYNIKTYRLLAAAGTALCLAILILCIMWLADTHKGYDVHTINANTYQIDVELTRDEAQLLLDNMQNCDTKCWPLRDVRLPNGILTTGMLTYEDAVDFLARREEHTIITTTWRSSEHDGTKISENDNLITTYLEFSYQEMMDALDALHESKDTHQVMPELIINLSAGRKSFCKLSLKELEEYTRRMHKVGANRIIIPFYWQNDPYSQTKYPVQRLL